ncbi:MAG: translation elongation factor Ts [Chloroflexota bacterium]|nr:MAG: translation elongation factor Ts [Chloroflexota bacterium]
MKIPVEVVKELRSRTNAGIGDCNKALLEVGGDMEKAIEFLKERGAAIAEKKKDLTATEGVVEAYVHHTKRMGALVEVNCETDFVARTHEFKELAHDLAMQIAATSPQFLASEEMPPEVETDPQATCLLSQPFIKEPEKTVQEVISETIAKVGENIKVRRFARFELGGDH